MSERSDQVQEILGRTPNWMIRWGTTLVFAIVALLLLGSAVISYNDIIPAQIVITSKNPPIYLKARSSGRLTKVLVQANQKIKKGDLLAEIENTAQLKDIIYLRKNLLDENTLIFSLDSLKKTFPSDLSLGTVQSAYGAYLTAY
ncbi:MAG: biotin/lipoyl-binding protein, partial [Planctomycetota bacterium]